MDENKPYDPNDVDMGDARLVPPPTREKPTCSQCKTGQPVRWFPVSACWFCEGCHHEWK